MLQMFSSVYKSYHHEDNNVILKNYENNFDIPDLGLYITHHLNL